MDKLLSSGINSQAVNLESYLLPPDIQPGNLKKSCKNIPVINLADGIDESIIIKQILTAGKEFGCFQVLNHGIPEKLMNDIKSAAENFFNLPTEDKAEYYSDDPNKLPILSTGAIVYRSTGKLYWRDFFRLNCYPVEEFKHRFPENPPEFRNAIADFTIESRGLALRILELVGKGLGIDEESYFDRVLEGAPIRMLINHYPPCPDPNSTLGLPKHADTTLLTLLLQRDVSGLQVLHGGEWVEVEPLPNAVIVIFGLPLEFITNGLVRAVEHQVVTNASTPRTTIGMFITPKRDCLIAPPKSLVNDQMPRRYKSFSYAEFTEAHTAAENDRTKTLNTFAIVQ